MTHAVYEEVQSALALAVMELTRVGKHADADIIIHAIDALRSARSEAAESELRAELENIAHAKRFDTAHFADDTAFADWAQSRAKFTLSKLPAPPTEGEGG